MLNIPNDFISKINGVYYNPPKADMYSFGKSILGLIYPKEKNL